MLEKGNSFTEKKKLNWEKKIFGARERPNSVGLYELLDEI